MKIFVFSEQQNIVLFVEFVDINFNSYKLLNKSRVVSVITGTLGFEAIVNSIPTFVFGNVLFKNAPNVINFKKNMNLEKISNELREKVNKEMILNYLNEQHLFLKQGYSDPLYSAQVEIDYDLNIANLVQIISEKIS